MKFIVLLSAAVFATNSFAIINGVQAAPDQFPEVVHFKSNAGCSGVVVGPRVVLTSASCVQDDEVVEIAIDSNIYRVKFSRSPFYPEKENDVAAGVAERDLPPTPLALHGSLDVGAAVQLAGFGCTDRDHPDHDGILRFGMNRITEKREQIWITEQPQGATACYGDGGGPLLYQKGGRNYVAGIIAYGNLINTTYSVRLDSEESLQFLREFAQKNQVEICGLTSDCPPSSR